MIEDNLDQSLRSRSAEWTYEVIPVLVTKHAKVPTQQMSRWLDFVFMLGKRHGWEANINPTLVLVFVGRWDCECKQSDWGALIYDLPQAKLGFSATSWSLALVYGRCDLAVAQFHTRWPGFSRALVQCLALSHITASSRGGSALFPFSNHETIVLMAGNHCRLWPNIRTT